MPLKRRAYASYQFVRECLRSSYDEALEERNGIVQLQFFYGLVERVDEVMELNRDVIVSAGQYTLNWWRISTGECLRTWTTNHSINGLMVKLTGDTFVTGSRTSLEVWDSSGEWIETAVVKQPGDIDAMARVKDYLTIAGGVLEVRQLK